MTTPDPNHDQHQQAAGPAEHVGPGNEAMQAESRHSQSSGVTPVDSASRPSESPAARAGSSTDESLFGEGLLTGLRSRWDDVQAGFVDDPRQCVEKADSLVSDVVERLTAAFAHARSRLEEQWARGEDASTEELRLALQRYREFFQRLLSVDDTKREHHDRPVEHQSPEGQQVT
ncbi:hypothetical protein ABGB19_09700 [Mycobacterium sp. B14F4]|uniref:hypothetical protein n=1 Tax=Mycobacterium sp. B14F4 TaxID=3153565 RepID=UPI00325F0A41